MTATLSHWTLPQWAAEHWPDGVAGPVQPLPLPPPESVSVGERLWRRLQVRRAEALSLSDRATSIVLPAPTVDMWLLGSAESVGLADGLKARVRKRKGKPLRWGLVDGAFVLGPDPDDLVLHPVPLNEGERP